MTDYEDVLGRFIHYADRLDEIMGARTRDAYAETCCCGGSVQIGVDVPARERSQLARHFIARHQHCTRPGRDNDIEATS